MKSMIKIKSKVYLIQFLESVYGKQPIKLPDHKDFLFKVTDDLSFSLKPFDNRKEEYDKETLYIEIVPKEGQRFNTYYHLLPIAEEMFNHEINVFFEGMIRAGINKLLLTRKLKRKDIIKSLMAHYRISSDHKDIFLSIYNRNRKSEWEKGSLKNKK